VIYVTLSYKDVKFPGSNSGTFVGEITDIFMNTAEANTVGTFRITGNWFHQSKVLKQKFGLLTDEDLKFEVGGEQDLLTRICERINKSREEVINIIRKGLPLESTE
tara:strand:- start:5997 stop:6314 length:318 start_codon:yes stop_codon:yes gene_type:complete